MTDENNLPDTEMRGVLGAGNRAADCRGSLLSRGDVRAGRRAGVIYP